jgi:hypothetical protein
VKISVLDAGCLANKSLSCQNEGICMSNGLCDCKYGFGGPTCSDCLFFYLLYNLSKLK